MKKKLLTTALIGVMLIGMFSLSSCGKTSDGGGTPGGGDREDLKVVDAEWYGIDVYQLDSSSNLQQLVSESLFEWDTDKNEIVDGTCTDWTVSEDGLTITFNVPDGMYYSTGEQVEPEDVKASIEHGQKVSPYADGYDNIKSIDIDGRQVTLHLSNYRRMPSLPLPQIPLLQAHFPFPIAARFPVRRLKSMRECCNHL